eukprot:TRINITY_DN1175_c0_g1_i17.p1 TRINITY_DN1175_c0_g1~~TRINITY_DN1175_c0_g1_i17.p1  ORF type:complete len:169 (+),score=34.78 TRINITY_DN1175_c0_g1_i17:436-942(+)
MYEVPNDWQDLIEEEESDYAQEMLSAYGPFSVVLYSRVKKLNLFSTESDNGFLGSLAGFYTDNMHNIGNEKSLQNIKDLVQQFPPIPKLLKLFEHYRQTVKETVFFKLAIDILENFYKKTEEPVYTELRSQVLPFAIKFYSSLNKLIINEINELIKSYVSRSKSLREV